MADENDLNVARRVLKQEISGLLDLEKALDDKFTKLVEKIHATTHGGHGRVILSGMGKSGHIAHKIAATLASTGTPSFFVHPGEASHGDLGMITKNDIVILLSNSGETSELKDIIAYCKRFGIFLVGIARRAGSALIEAADIGFALPETAEANNVNAPTTSTTMMLAFGDALAVTLLEKQGFESKDFKNFHPGGKLGAAFTVVNDLMHKGDEIPLVTQNDKMSEVLIKIAGRKFGCAGVVNQDGMLEGIITDGDLRRHMDGNFLNKTAAEVMTKNPMTIRPRALAAEALNIMNSKRVTALFITEHEKPAGIIHIHDLLRAGIG